MILVLPLLPCSKFRTSPYNLPWHIHSSVLLNKCTHNINTCSRSLNSLLRSGYSSLCLCSKYFITAAPISRDTSSSMLRVSAISLDFIFANCSIVKPWLISSSFKPSQMDVELFNNLSIQIPFLNLTAQSYMLSLIYKVLMADVLLLITF